MRQNPASKTVFSYAFRIVVCTQCGAPLQSAPTGGMVQCQYCRVGNQVRPRDDRADRDAAGIRATVDEATRFARLREQDGKPVIPPPNLQHLFVGGSIPSQMLPEALALWQQALAELKAPPAAGGFPGANVGASERLYFLTVSMGSSLAGDPSQDLRIRSLLETACDHLKEPTYRQDLHGMLCRYAAKAGDLDGAQGWLSLCAPYSDNLRADTAYRYSYAYLATCKGDYQGAIQALGRQPHDVPILDSSDFICDLLRANAHERMGNLALAQQQLATFAAHPVGRTVLPQCVAAHPNLDLCARTRVGALAQSAPINDGGLKINWGGMAMMVVMPVAICGFSLFSMPSDAASSALPIMGFILGGFVLVAAGIAAFVWHRKRRQAFFNAHGIDGHGKILSVGQTGVQVNDQPQIALELEVYAGSIPAFRTTLRRVVAIPDLMAFQPGGTIALKVDPNNPKNIHF